MDSCCSVPEGPIPAPEVLASQAVLLKAMADPTRLWLLHRLGGGEVCVCDLNVDVLLSQATLSHHLRVLGEAGLVSARKSGRWSLYQTTGSGRRMLEALALLEPQRDDGGGTAVKGALQAQRLGPQ